MAHRSLGWSAVAFAVLLLSAPLFAVADDDPTTAVIAHLANDPRTPDAYAAQVEIHVRLRMFPYFGVTLRGTSEYRRPGSYHYVLHGLPMVAAKFNDLRYDLGDPVTWPQRYDIALAPQSTPDAPVMRMTPKSPGMVAYLDVETDTTDAHIARATWVRHDGGRIVLTQTYGATGNHDVVTDQHATIEIPHMRAELDAHYSAIVIESATLATVPER